MIAPAKDKIKSNKRLILGYIANLLSNKLLSTNASILAYKSLDLLSPKILRSFQISNFTKLNFSFSEILVKSFCKNYLFFY